MTQTLDNANKYLSYHNIVLFHLVNLKIVLTDLDFEVAVVKAEEGEPGSSAGRSKGEAYFEVSGSLMSHRLLMEANLRGG